MNTPSQTLNTPADALLPVRVNTLVVGSGISGLFTALKIAENLTSPEQQVLLVTKSSMQENNSRYAQGGIAAFLPDNTQDSLEQHVRDTLIAGAGLCDEAVVRSLLAEGHLAIADLLLYGVPFDRDALGNLALTREAAHSVNRIIHAGGDATGEKVESTLIAKVRAHAQIQVMEHTAVVRLLMDETHTTCTGAVLVQYPDTPPDAVSPESSTLQPIQVIAQHTVLATGGIGRLYKHTTNPTIATGDGMALAQAAGVPLKDMAFVQFHPTAFFHDGRVRFLISEALRGEGAILKTVEGVPFAKRYHPDGEMAPRDVVTRAIFSELTLEKEHSGADYVLLDIRHLSPEFLEQRFPTILKACLSFGIDIRTQPIPVAPAAHYMMGGFAVDENGVSAVKHLYGVGETVHTGLHGANRLASNSLLECLVLARRVAAQIGASPSVALALGAVEKTLANPVMPLTHTPHHLEITAQVNALQHLMWQHVSIVRDHSGLTTTLDTLHGWLDNAMSQQWPRIVPMGLEYVNQLNVAIAITQDALQREASLGAHFRKDEASPATLHKAASSVSTVSTSLQPVTAG